MTDNEIIREAIELFAVQYFRTIEMSGNVLSIKQEKINYLSIDLKEISWDKNIEKLNLSLKKYLQEWAKLNISNFNDHVSISSLTIEYILPEEDGKNQNVSKLIKLFHIPQYLFNTSDHNSVKKYPVFVIKFLKIWHNIFLRNFIIAIVPTIILIVASIIKIQTDLKFQARLIKSYDYINIASGIIASFVLGFLINKVIAIRQDKLKYTKSIKKLSNKLTYFRNICYNFSRDHDYWSQSNPHIKSYEYARSISNKISFVDYYYPNMDDDIEYAKYKSFYNEDMSHSIVLLILQLHMMAGELFINSGLTFTKFPPNYIYTHEEMKRFKSYCIVNQIWYCSSEIKIFPETFLNSYNVKEIIEDINRIYPNNKIETLSNNKLKLHICPK